MHVAPTDFTHWNEIFRRNEIPLTLGTVDTPGEGARLTLLGAEHGEKERVPTLLVRPVVVEDPRHYYPSEHSDFVLAPRVTPQVAESFREKGVMFLDERGNCFVSRPGILIDVRGRTTTLAADGPGHPGLVGARPRKRTASLFTPRRAQVAAVLLARPEIAASPIRYVAQEAGVSTGTAMQTLDLLAQSGYLSSNQLSGGYRLERGDELLSAWAQSFATGLGAELEVFRGTGDLKRLAHLYPLGWVSGEQALSHLVMGGETAHIYLDDPAVLSEVLREGRFRRAENGEIHICTAFWPTEGGRESGLRPPERVLSPPRPLAGWPVAPLPIVYADLVSTGEPRLMEVAEQVRSEFKF